MNNLIRTKYGRLINPAHISEYSALKGEGFHSYRRCWLMDNSDNHFDVYEMELERLIFPPTTITPNTSGHFSMLEFLPAHDDITEEVVRYPVTGWAHCDGFYSQPVMPGGVPCASNKWNDDMPLWLLDHEIKIVHNLPLMDEELANGLPFDQWLKERREESEGGSNEQ